MRILAALLVASSLSGCGVAATDVAIGAGAGYLLFGDEIEQVEAEDLQDPETYRDAVPPQAKQGAKRVATNVRDNVRHNSRRLKEWWFYDPEEAAKGPQPVDPKYCYRVMQDILCYPGPMAGWETRLVAYQGTGAPAPAKVRTKPLPKLARDGYSTGPMRLKKADPVFNQIPEEPPKQPVTTDQPVDAAGQEVLPDPLISPQL